MDDPMQPVRRPDFEPEAEDPGTEPEMPVVREPEPQPVPPPEAAGWVPPQPAPAHVVRAPLPGSVMTAAIVLLVMGVLAALFAVLMFLASTTYNQLPASNFGGLSDEQLESARRLGAVMATAFGVVAGVVAIGHIASGIGVLRRAGWGRVLGMVFAGLGLLFTGLLAMLSAVLLVAQLPATTIAESGLTAEQYTQVTRMGGIIGLVIFGICALAYLFTLIALIRGGRAFD
jgi:hypothetical protein